MNRDENLEQLANIIKDYRKGELEFTPDKQHVEKWLSQFLPETQDVILFEILHIFREWYFTNQYVDERIDRIPPYLQKKQCYSSMHSVFDSVFFLNLQNDGQSQHTIISRFADRVYEQYGISINTEIKDNIKHYIYVDDGLYTGSRARKDILDCISCLPQTSRLEVFYIMVCESAFRYTKQFLSDYAQKHNVNLSMHNWKTIWNDKTSSRNSDGSKESWNLHHDCLWPDPSLKANSEVVAFIEKFPSVSKSGEKYLFRKKQWASDAGPFTSVDNRNIVEKEFLLQGIKILSKVSENKGMYPLGYNLWPSFGLGSVCSFDMNISNTCPLVLWWGNNKEKGNALDSWYPLLPRRVNGSAEIKLPLDDVVYWGERNSMDQYNMCPDCGNFFGLEDDGGNGFCVNCAWKH